MIGCYIGGREGAASGALTGGLFALGHSIIRTIQIANYASKGILIGKMSSLKDVSSLSETPRYQGLKSHKLLSKIFGKSFADEVG